MYKNKKTKKRNLIILSVVIVAIIALVSSIQLNRANFFGEGLVKSVIMTIDKIVMYPFTALNGEKNVDQSESYLIQKNVNASLEKEIQELKEVLDLKTTLTEYTPINATI